MGNLKLSFSLLAIILTYVNQIEANSPPYFVKNIDLTVVHENTPIGTSVYQLVAEDPEKSPVVFSLNGTNLFRVDRRSGIVTVNALIDRERVGDSIKFFVTAEDVVGGGHQNNVVRVPVTIIILDENDNPPKFVDHSKTLKVNLSEDTSVGETIISTIQVKDQDLVGSILKLTCNGCENTYKLVYDNAVNEPTVNYLSFSVILNEAVEYNPKAYEHSFILTASDGLFNTSLHVEIRIMDIQNKPPIFIGSTSAIIPENATVGSLVMKLKAMDGDVMSSDSIMEGFSNGLTLVDSESLGRSVTYEMVYNPGEYFSLDSNSGEVRIAKKLNKEDFPSTNGVITLNVRAIENVGNKYAADPEPLSSTLITLTITLQDVNDEPPRFNKHDYYVDVLEGVPNGTPLTSLDMFVEDTDSGSNSVFNIALIDSSGIFSVEPPIATGSTSVSIRVANGPLDYENPNQRKFILLVVAKEAFTQQRLSSTATVTVTVTDANDNKPLFDQQLYSGSVLEDAMAGTIVLVIKATDRDSKPITNLTYSIFGNGAELFDVNPSSGVITVGSCSTPGYGNCIDYETRTNYYLSFQVSDGHGQSSVVPLSIHVMDANDNPPQFVRNGYQTIVDEGSLKFEPPLRVKATDADITSVITYSILSGNEENLFAMEPRSGEIKINSPVRSKSEQISLIVQAADGGKGIATTEVKITIRDANDHSPYFEKSKYITSISESQMEGSFVEQVQAEDDDTGLNAEIMYKIQKGAFDDFEIDRNNGIIKVKNKLDYDRRNEYELELIAVDKGVPAKTGTSTLILHIINHNNKAPYFIRGTQRTQLNEDVQVGDKFYQLTAVDPDSDSIESLVYNVVQVTAVDKNGLPLLSNSTANDEVGKFFDITPKTGEVFVLTKLNRDLASVVSLNVSVTDVSSTTPQIGYGSLIITIIDHNDYAPTFVRPWTPERPEFIFSTLEEQPVGTVLANLLATDVDSKISHYSIIPENEYFKINNQSGVVTVKKVIDYETIMPRSTNQEDFYQLNSPGQLKFNVFAYDTGIPQLYAMAKVIVNVININDNEPIFGQNFYEVSIKENIAPGTSVLTVNAVDIDSGKYGRVKYSLVVDNSENFVINEDTGEIKIANGANIDREVGPNKFTLQVAVTDDVEPQRDHGSDGFPDTHSARLISVPVYINVEDVNDNSPKFVQKVYEVTTLGNADGFTEKGIPVTQVSASDPDKGLHGSIKYKITSGNLNDIFEIDEKSGAIYAKKSPLDINENVYEYNLKIEARDIDGDGPFFDEAELRITVIDVNRHKPRFLKPLGSEVKFLENQKPGTKIIQVEAVDDDTGKNGAIKYSFKVDGSRNVQETDDFRIDPDSGLIMSKKAFDREEQDKFELILSAQDHLGEPQVFEVLQKLAIVIQDLNDCKPEFERNPKSVASFSFNLAENEPRGSKIGKIKAIDKDSDEANRKIYYYIIDGNHDYYFHIDKMSGQLYSNQTFDREEHEDYELVVKATSNSDLKYYMRTNEEAGTLSKVSVKDRSFNPEDLSLCLVRIKILDVNDNKPAFQNQIFRAGISHKADIGQTVLIAEAIDSDSAFNSSLTYSIANTDLFRKSYDAPKTAVRPIPTPFMITQDGRVVTTELMAQFPVESRFILHLEAQEKAPPHRIAHAKVFLWIYNPAKLIQITLKLNPEDVHSRKSEIESILSNATEYRSIITDIKYHANPQHGKVVKEWSDVFVMVVDDRTFSDVNSKHVIVKLDTDSHLHRNQQNLIETISIASTDPVFRVEELDVPLIILIVLIVLMVLGFVTMAVCCCCLKSWYHQKFLEKAMKSARKAKVKPVRPRDNASVHHGSHLTPSIRGPDKEAKVHRTNTADKRQQIPGTATENPLWTENAHKFYEEQELSMRVSPAVTSVENAGNEPSTSATNSNDMDAESSYYSSVADNPGRLKVRQRQPDDNHEYHELEDNNKKHDKSPSLQGEQNLGTNSKGVPELVGHLL